MSDLVKIRYVGQEEIYSDHNYNSGATWLKGGVVAVRAECAERLLHHPEFEAAPTAKKFDVAEPGLVEDELPEEPPLANLESMTKDQMIAYAHRNFGVVLDKKDKAETLRDSIRTRMGSSKRGY